ncbi:proteasome subunit beta type-2-like [Drosophila obscura]|uniref:proteasome subunit beta type-2-like n=1 Tax=Drosophila obscura TaxID=7282 RepID=UPI001BB1395E|nr:proteasome subunit beta type-2-like [Drosophila obscura]
MFNAAATWQARSQSPPQRSSTGFSFVNRERNSQFAQCNGFIPMPPTTTGSTVVGVQYRDGVIIATDRKGTADGMVTTNCMKKLYRLQDNIYAGGCGVCGDLHQLARLTHAQMELHRLRMHGHVPVVCANQFVKHLLYRYQGHIQVNLIIGGVDSGGASLYATRFEGTTDKIPFAVQGSGHLAGMAVLEKRWHARLDEKAAESLAIDAVSSGIRNDLFSGSPIHICVIRTDYSVALYDKIFAVNIPPRQSALRVKRDLPKVLFAMDHPIEPVDNSLYTPPLDSDKLLPKGSRTALALARHRSKKNKQPNQSDA